MGWSLKGYMIAIGALGGWILACFLLSPKYGVPVWFVIALGLIPFGLLLALRLHSKLTCDPDSDEVHIAFVGAIALLIGLPLILNIWFCLNAWLRQDAPRWLVFGAAGLMGLFGFCLWVWRIYCKIRGKPTGLEPEAHGRCSKCGHDLHIFDSPVCPDCEPSATSATDLLSLLGHVRGKIVEECTPEDLETPKRDLGELYDKADMNQV